MRAWCASPATDPASSRSVRLSSSCRSSGAGAMPKRMAVTSESSAVNRPTRRSGAVERARDNWLAWHHADQQLAQPDRQHQARAAAHERQYQALGQQLADQTSASRAKRQTNRNLLLPARRARQQEVGDVSRTR